VSAYRTFAQLSQVIAALAGASPTVCETFTLAQPSVEGAVITGLHIHAGDAKGNRNGVLLVGGVHARELMNPEAIVDLAADLLISYANDTDITYAVPGSTNALPGSGPLGATWGAATIRMMLESLDIWMVPCSNPDGHDYVLSTDNMWRKNRRPEKGSCSDGTQPVGVDLNRNCAIVWGVIPTNGNLETSCDPCDYQVYAGPAAFSEPESANIEQFLSDHPIDTFADVHSYEQMILYPWGHAPEQTTDPAENFTTLQTGTCNPLPDSSYSEYIDPVDLIWFQFIGNQIASDVAKVRGSVYTAGSSISLLYPTTGTNPDYAYSRHIADQGAHKTYGWTIETGPYNGSVLESFQPSDPSHIILDIKAAMLSLLMQSACPIELIGTELFGADAEAAEDQLTGIRAWRDALRQTDAGRAWLELYRQLHPTLLERIAGDEGFRSRVGELVEMAVALADDPDSVLSDDHIRSGLAVIDDLAAASPEHLRIQLRTARAVFQTMSGFSAQAALAVVAERSPT
jgi:Zinc carboxypeptidase